MVPRKSHLGSPGSFSRAPHLPTPAPHSAGPGPSRKERSARTGAFPKCPRLGQIRPKPAGRAAGAGQPGRPGGSGDTSPTLQLGLAEAWERGFSSLLRPGPWTEGRPRGRAPSVPVSPRPRGGSAGSGLPWRHLLADGGVQVRSASRAAVPPASLPPPAP